MSKQEFPEFLAAHPELSVTETVHEVWVDAVRIWGDLVIRLVLAILRRPSK